MTYTSKIMKWECLNVLLAGVDILTLCGGWCITHCCFVTEYKCVCLGKKKKTTFLMWAQTPASLSHSLCSCIWYQDELPHTSMSLCSMWDKYIGQHFVLMHRDSARCPSSGFFFTACEDDRDFLCKGLRGERFTCGSFHLCQNKEIRRFFCYFNSFDSLQITKWNLPSSTSQANEATDWNPALEHGGFFFDYISVRDTQVSEVIFYS